MSNAQQLATIEWVEVDSSNVKAVAYDPATEILAVRFANGGLYSYADVTQTVFTGLAGAQSVGKYLNTVIKGVHPYTLHPDENDLLVQINHRRK